MLARFLYDTPLYDSFSAGAPGPALEVRRLEGGQTNTTYLACLRAEPQARFVVRLYEREPEACMRDVALSERLRADLPELPPVLASGVLDHAPHEGLPYAISPFVAGIPLDRALDEAAAERSAEVAAEIADRVADFLVRLSAVRFDAPGRLDGRLELRAPFESHARALVDYVRWCVAQGRARRRLGRERCERLLDLVVAHAPGLDVTGSGASLVHGDFKPANLLVGVDASGRFELRAVLDWEYAHSGDPLYDVAALLRALAPWAREPFEEVLTRRFVAHGLCTPGRFAVVRTLYDLKDLCGLARASARHAPPAPALAAAADDLLDRLENRRERKGHPPEIPQP